MPGISWCGKPRGQGCIYPGVAPVPTAAECLINCLQVAYKTGIGDLAATSCLCSESCSTSASISSSGRRRGPGSPNPAIAEMPLLFRFRLSCQSAASSPVLFHHRPVANLSLRSKDLCFFRKICRYVHSPLFSGCVSAGGNTEFQENATLRVCAAGGGSSLLARYGGGSSNNPIPTAKDFRKGNTRNRERRRGSRAERSNAVSEERSLR